MPVKTCQDYAAPEQFGNGPNVPTSVTSPAPFPNVRWNSGAQQLVPPIDFRLKEEKRTATFGTFSGLGRAVKLIRKGAL